MAQHAQQEEKVFIGVLGPSTGGKSSLVNGICAYRPTFGRIAFADYLKEEATRRGWNGEKDAAGRLFLQSVSEDLKREHGESVFYDVGIQKALQSPYRCVMFDDTRFFIEILPFMKHDHGGAFLSCVITLEEEQAEARWLEAVTNPAKECDWARHRSETEWRVLRHLFPTFKNDKALGLEICLNRFQTFIATVHEQTIGVY